MAFAKKKSSGRAWSPEEVLKFCDMWPDYSVRAIKEAFPDRSWRALREKAREHKLGPRFQGYVSMTQAADLIGYTRRWFYNRIRKGELTYYKVGVGKKSTRFAFDIDEVTEYAKRQLELETILDGAKRHNMSSPTLTRAYIHCHGALPGKACSKRRLEPSKVDEAVEHWKSHIEKQNAARAARMRELNTKRYASPAGSTVSLSSKPKDNSSGRSSCSSATESTLGQAA